MLKKLQELFERTAQKGTGLLGIGFKDMNTGEEVYYNGDKVFPLASVYKIFVLCELFRMQKAGTFSFADRHTLLESEKSIGSGILELIGEGAVFSMMDLIMLMMSISDNTATKLLQQYTSDETVTANIIEPLGMQDTLYRSGAGLCNYYNVTVEEYRKVTSSGGRFHARNGSYFRCVEPKNRQSSPRDMLKLLSLLQAGKFIDEETDRKILDIMLKCQTNSRIPAKLPHGVTVAHKTGTIDHLTNDCGIVYTDCGSYVLTLFYNGNLASEEEYEGTSWDAFGTALLAQLSRDIYDIYTESYQK
jgi:beta-lactamase class A